MGRLSVLQRQSIGASGVLFPYMMLVLWARRSARESFHIASNNRMDVRARIYLWVNGSEVYRMTFRAGV